MTALQITTQPEPEGVVRLCVAGELDMDSAEQLLGAVWQAARVEGTSVILVDLAHLSFLDAAGIKALLSARRQAGRQGIALRVAHAQGAPRRVLIITGLLAILQTVE